MSGVLGQVAAVTAMLARSSLNAVRRRQSRGGVVMLPLALAFIALQVWRFGERAAHGIGAVLQRAEREPAVAYASFWLSALFVALTAFKLGRALPGRGQSRMFDTPLLRALPLSPAARVLCELALVSTHGLSFALLIVVPVVYGVARHAHQGLAAGLITAAIALVVTLVTSLVALALQAMLTRISTARTSEAVRMLSYAASFALFMAFVVAGPVTAHRIDPPPFAHAWPFAPVRALVECLVGGRPSLHTVLLALAGPWLPTMLAIGVLARYAPTLPDALTPPPRAPARTLGVEGSLGALRAQLRMVRRQSPALFLVAPGFVLFFALAASLLAEHGGLPRELLLAMNGWAMAVAGTAVAGATARRERRTLGLWLAASGGHARLVRGSTLAAIVMLAPLALGPLVLVGEAALRLVAFTLLALATLVVALWAQTSAMYLCLDPAPDRLAGLSVAGAFGVMSAALPSAVLLLAAALAPPAMTVGVLAVYALLAWCLERAAVDRLRWILDPAGDPHAAAHAWPALRALGVALLVQVLTGALLAWLGVPLPGVVVGAYVMFTAVLVPWAWRGRRAALAVEAVAPRWTHARAVLTGIVGGVLTCGAALAYLRWIAPGTEATSSLPVAGALREAGVLGRVALAAVVMLCAPVAEEMLFRGWLQPALGHDLPRRWRAWALVPAAAVFTLVHPLPAWGPVGLAGLLSGALLARSGRLSGSLALHVTHNSLVLAISLAGPWLVDAGR